MDPKSIPQFKSPNYLNFIIFKSSKISKYSIQVLKFPQTSPYNLHQILSNKPPNLKLHLESQFPISNFKYILFHLRKQLFFLSHQTSPSIKSRMKKYSSTKRKKKKKRKYSVKILLPVPEQRANWRPILVASESLLSPCQRRSFQLVSRDVQVALEIEMFRDLPVARHPLARPH